MAEPSSSHAPGRRGSVVTGLLAGAALCAAALLTACGADPEPRWIGLARGHEPRALAATVEAWERAEPGPTGNAFEADPFGVTLTHDYLPSAWSPGSEPGLLRTGLPGGAFRASGCRARLVGRALEFPAAAPDAELAVRQIRIHERRLILRLRAEENVVPPTVLRLRVGAAPAQERPVPPALWRVGRLPSTFELELPSDTVLEGPDAPRLFAELTEATAEAELAPFEYRFEAEQVTLRLPDGARAPAARLSARLENGRALDGAWQLRLGPFCADGIPVWSGEHVESTTPLPARSRLLFRFFHAALGAGEVVARVRLDGVALWQETFRAGAQAEPRFVEVALPERPAATARLSFEVEGRPGLGAFFTPELAPLEPARAVAPDLVLFVADTFRADSLAHRGGDPALAPRLNAFAAQALCFTRARSNAAWTLPSIGSLLTGMAPGQHGATDEDLSLPHENVTLAERLSAAGYRTGAITDGSFFAPVFGLDQGFEWFSQHDPGDWNLDRTLVEARSFLEQGDGRPTFLVVHTYRAHQPYRTGPEEDRAGYDALMARARLTAGTDSPDPVAGNRALAAHGTELRGLYQAGVRDLDAGFGDFVETLEAHGYFEHGHLLFTSDHGEALGENDEFFHGGHLWEIKLAVPLLLRGPGIEPGAVDRRATLLDVVPTLAALAGLAPDPAWSGSSLLALDHERPAFAWQLAARSRQVAFVEGARKVIMTPAAERLERGDCEEAFDLSDDPAEAHNLATSEEWPAELTRRLRPELLRQLEPVAASERAGVTDELRRALEGIGYGGH